MKVYLVIRQAAYEGYDIVKAFGDRDVAIEFGQQYVKENFRRYDKFDLNLVRWNEDGCYLMELDVE